jgi:hypothetical protein
MEGKREGGEKKIGSREGGAETSAEAVRGAGTAGPVQGSVIFYMAQ